MKFRIYEHNNGNGKYYTVKEKGWFFYKVSESYYLATYAFTGTSSCMIPVTFSTLEEAEEAIQLRSNTYRNLVVKDIDTDRDYPRI